jgi:tungstate transport system substrate-binding protein
MLDTLIMADETDAYTLSDKSTFLSNADKLPHLAILFERNDELINLYSVTLINPEIYLDLEHEGAGRFHDWLLLPSTQERIAEYGQALYGESLFFID